MSYVLVTYGLIQSLGAASQAAFSEPNKWQIFPIILPLETSAPSTRDSSSCK